MRKPGTFGKIHFLKAKVILKINFLMEAKKQEHSYRGSEVMLNQMLLHQYLLIPIFQIACAQCVHLTDVTRVDIASKKKFDIFHFYLLYLASAPHVSKCDAVSKNM